MNFKSLFQLLRLPTKGGKNTSAQASKRVVRNYFLEFTDIEDSPSYALESTLSVGSETGDIVIEEPSLAPHHASFTLKDGIVTIQDLGSKTGTALGEHSLTKGKPVILKADDVLMLGDLKITLRVVEEEIEVEEEVIAAEPEAAAEEVVEEPAPAPEIISPQDKLQKRLEQVRNKPRKKINAVAIGGGSTRSANMLTRAMGVLFDAMITISIWQILSPFDEFREFNALLPQTLQEHVLPFIEFQIAELGFTQDYELLMKEFLELISDAEEKLHLSHLASLFISWRLLGTLLFGVTIGSWMSGVRAYGNVLWKRLGGVIREGLGWVLRATLIADLPTLFSRRSLQEMLTFTHLFSPSKGVILILWLLFFPLLVAFMLLSPLFSGLEMPTPIALSETNLRAKKVAKQESEANTNVEVVHSSAWFGARFELPSQTWKLLPRFSWSQNGKSRSLVPSLVFYHQGGTTVPLMLEQTFSWPALLNLALAHNPPMQQSFPNLWAYAQSDKMQTGSVIQYNPSSQDRLKLQTELQELIKVVFAMTPETIMEHVMSYGPLIKGPMEFRRAVVSLFKADESGNWIISRFGKHTMLVYENPGVKPFELMVPLVFGQGRIFRVGYASSAEWNKASRLVRGELWPHSGWELSANESVEGAPKVIDVIAKVASGSVWEEGQLESLYGFFFEAATVVVGLPAEDGHKIALIKSIQNLEEVLLRLEKNKSLAAEKVAVLEKLRLKVAEVRGRVELSDGAFFAPEPIPAPTPAPVTPTKKKR